MISKEDISVLTYDPGRSEDLVVKATLNLANAHLVSGQIKDQPGALDWAVSAARASILHKLYGDLREPISSARLNCFRLCRSFEDDVAVRAAFDRILAKLP